MAKSDLCPWCRKRESGDHACYDAYADLEREHVALTEEVERLRAERDRERTLAEAFGAAWYYAGKKDMLGRKIKQ